MLLCLRDNADFIFLNRFQSAVFRTLFTGPMDDTRRLDSWRVIAEQFTELRVGIAHKLVDVRGRTWNPEVNLGGIVNGRHLFEHRTEEGHMRRPRLCDFFCFTAKLPEHDPIVRETHKNATTLLFHAVSLDRDVIGTTGD